MKAICTRCQGSGYDPYIETKLIDLNRYWRCKNCERLFSHEPVGHTCKRKNITKLGKAV